MSLFSSITGAPPLSATNKQIFVKLMPLLMLCYFMSFLDRTNVALAKESLEIDLGISAAAYGLGAGLFFIGYASMEIPSNLIMAKVGARWWIFRIMITWGALSAGMAFVQGETSFYVMRILLGIAEAGLFPGIMLYMTYWFRTEIRARAIGMFLVAICFSSIIFWSWRAGTRGPRCWSPRRGTPGRRPSRPAGDGTGSTSSSSTRPAG